MSHMLRYFEIFDLSLMSFDVFCKATDLKVLPVSQKAQQNEASGAEGEGLDGPEMLFKGPQEVLQRVLPLEQRACCMTCQI